MAHFTLGPREAS